jgi:hypothetical protein
MRCRLRVAFARDRHATCYSRYVSAPLQPLRVTGSAARQHYARCRERVALERNRHVACRSRSALLKSLPSLQPPLGAGSAARPHYVRRRRRVAIARDRHAACYSSFISAPPQPSLGEGSAARQHRVRCHVRVAFARDRHVACRSRSALSLVPPPPAAAVGGQRRPAAPCAPQRARDDRARQAFGVQLALRPPLSPPSHCWGWAAPRGSTMCAADSVSRQRETSTWRATRAPKRPSQRSLACRQSQPGHWVGPRYAYLSCSAEPRTRELLTACLAPCIAPCEPAVSRLMSPHPPGELLLAPVAAEPSRVCCAA